MEILQALGVNTTLWVQIVFFLVTYIALSNLLFKPYFKAYLTRSEKTVGNTELAEKLLLEAKELEGQYEFKARELNAQVRSVYEKTRLESSKEQEARVAEARSEAKKILDETQQRIKGEVERAKSDLSKEVSGVSQAITSKLLGKDLAV